MEDHVSQHRGETKNPPATYRLAPVPKRMGRCHILRFPFAVLIFLHVVSCGAFNLGKWKGIEWTSKAESHWLLKNVFLTGGSAYNPRDTFDHSLQDTVNLVFVPSNEKPHYISRSVWTDPSGEEFRVIRQTHDKNEESQRMEERNEKGTTRIHSVSTHDLFSRGVGKWTVEVYIDDVLARKLTFTLR